MAKTNLKIPVCHIRSKQGLGQALPNKKLSQGADHESVWETLGKQYDI